MEIPVWVVILLIGFVGSLFWYGLTVFLNKFYDNRPIVCGMCGILVVKKINDKCPNCSQKLQITTLKG